jgi:hypothetical protein
LKYHRQRNGDGSSTRTPVADDRHEGMTDMKFEILLHENQESYAETKRAIITQRLTTALLLLLQELEATDLKYTSFIGKGISGEASIEIADKQDELKRWHDETFQHDEELRKQIQSAVSQNSMVQPRTR